MEQAPKQRRGFALLDPERRHQIARRLGLATGTVSKWRTAWRKQGRV